MEEEGNGGIQVYFFPPSTLNNRDPDPVREGNWCFEEIR